MYIFIAVIIILFNNSTKNKVSIYNCYKTLLYYYKAIY